MALDWGKVGENRFETGVSKCALYVINEGVYGDGVAWRGITGVDESPSGAEATPFYADNKKYLNLMSAEEYGATINAFMYPDEFAICDGSVEIAKGVTIGQQTRKAFGLCYRTEIGNDTAGAAHGYKLHIVYNALAAPSPKTYETINESPEAMTMSWEITTTPVEVPGHKPTSTLVIDSTKVDATKLKALEDLLYGSGTTAKAKLPLPAEVITLIGKA